MVHSLRGRKIFVVCSDSRRAAPVDGALREAGVFLHLITPDDLRTVSRKLLTSRPDLLLFDMECLGDFPITGIPSLIEPIPSGPIAIVTSEETSTTAQTAHRLGITLIPPPGCPVEFVERITHAVTPELPCLRALTARAVRLWSLSPQQARVLYFNLWSLSNQEIADKLNLTLNTVQDYQVALRRKTGARSKDGYLRRILECAGICPPEDESSVAPFVTPEETHSLLASVSD